LDLVEVWIFFSPLFYLFVVSLCIFLQDCRISEVADSERPLPSSDFRISGISEVSASGVVDAPSLAVEVEIRCASFWEAQGVPEPAVSLPMATMAESASMAQPIVLWSPLLGFSVTLLG